jgi:hypothetical protein
VHAHYLNCLCLFFYFLWSFFYLHGIIIILFTNEFIIIELQSECTICQYYFSFLDWLTGFLRKTQKYNFKLSSMALFLYIAGILSVYSSSGFVVLSDFY